MAASSPKLHQDIFDHYGNKNNAYLSPSEALFDDSDVYTSEEEDESSDEREQSHESVRKPQVTALPTVTATTTTTTTTTVTAKLMTEEYQQTPQPPRTDLAAPRPTENPTIFQKLTKANIDWCRYCGTTEGVNWRPGPWGKRTLCK